VSTKPRQDPEVLADGLGPSPLNSVFDGRKGSPLSGVRRAGVIALAGIGAVSLLAVLALVGLSLHGRYRDQHPRPTDLAYILGWAGLAGDTEIVEVLHSYNSGANPIVGDRVEVYALRLSRTLSDLDKANSKTKVWQRGPVGEPLLVEALETAVRFARSEAPWFPESEIVNSSRFFLSFQTITAYHQQTEAVDMTAYDTDTHILYHAEIRW
jgi:hypothetical protein